MINKFNKIVFSKEVLMVLIISFTIIFYLKSKVTKLEIDEIVKEVKQDVLQQSAYYLDKEDIIDYSQAFKNSFYNGLPFTQIFEYKKETTINEVVTKFGEIELSESESSLLMEVKLLFDFRNAYEILLGSQTNANTKYFVFQILGFALVFLIIITIYLILLKLKTSSLIHSFLFVITVLYLTNLSFYIIKCNIKDDTKNKLEKLKFQNIH